jgi:ankyrin repeat protein
MVAALNGHAEVVKILIGAGFPVGDTNNDGCTALICAADRGQAHLIPIFLRAGSDVNHPSKFGSTPLIHACQNAHQQCVKVLLEHKASVHTRTNDGNSALQYACNSGDALTVDLLLSNSADINCASAKGWTPLMCSVNKSHGHVAKALLERGANPNLCRLDGSTALMIAASKGLLAESQILVQWGALATLRDKKGAAASDYAQKAQQEKISQYLKTVVQQQKTLNMTVADGSERPSPTDTAAEFTKQPTRHQSSIGPQPRIGGSRASLGHAAHSSAPSQAYTASAPPSQLGSHYPNNSGNHFTPAQSVAGTYVSELPSQAHHRGAGHKPLPNIPEDASTNQSLHSQVVPLTEDALKTLMKQMGQGNLIPPSHAPSQISYRTSKTRETRDQVYSSAQWQEAQRRLESEIGIDERRAQAEQAQKLQEMANQQQRIALMKQLEAMRQKRREEEEQLKTQGVILGPAAEQTLVRPGEEVGKRPVGRKRGDPVPVAAVPSRRTSSNAATSVWGMCTMCREDQIPKQQIES